MSRFWKFMVIAVLMLGLLLPTSLLTVGCGDEDTTTTAKTTVTTAETTATTVDSSSMLAERANAVLTAESEYTGNSIKAEELSAMLPAAGGSPTLFLLDVRAEKDFAAGHIEGAVNVPFAEWAAPENLKALPEGMPIVVVCYTGHTAAQVVGGLRMLGYDAIALRAGMMGWMQGTSNQTVADSLLAAANPVLNVAANASATAEKGGALTQPSKADYEVIASEANTNMSAMPTTGDFNSNVITAEALSAQLAGAGAADLFLLDIRSAKDYEEVGHIEGTINIPFTSVAVEENLAMLPKDKKLIIICYTGNTASQAASILQLLGYDTATLKYGMMSWTVTGQTQGFVDDITTADYPVVQ